MYAAKYQYFIVTFSKAVKYKHSFTLTYIHVTPFVLEITNHHTI